jgi:catechol 2,3-dioxygenase-like lactoylglutathione lyase family enzyme
MALEGVSHVSMTVADLERSKAWYAAVLDWNCLSDGRSDTTTFAYGTLPGGTTIVLRVHDEPQETTFDERRVGLDHLSFTATDEADLATVEERVRAQGTTFTPMQDASFGKVLPFRDPDNIALELVYRRPAS